MRNILFLLPLAFGLLSSASAHAAPAPPAGSDWQRVLALPPGSKVHVKADGQSSTCRIETVDADSLTCKGGMGGIHKFPQASVISVKASRYIVSTLAGTGIGAAGGFVVGAALPHSSSSLFTRGETGAIFAAPGAVIGAILGGATDFCKGTVYRRAKPTPATP